MYFSRLNFLMGAKRMDKPKAETISYYDYIEVAEYIHKKYHIDKAIFNESIKKLNPFAGEMIYMHLGDYVAYQRYDSEELLKWYRYLIEEFGLFIVLCWEEK
jgi:hypothetical protein